MPIYQYQCENCEAVVEHICGFRDRPEYLDHKCRGRHGKKGKATPLMSAPAYVRIAIDASGRRGYVTNMGDGKKTVRSATRERYEHLAGSRGAKEFKEMGRDATKSVYTRSYESHRKQHGIKERKT